MKIETLAEKIGLTYEQFEAVAYTYWHETNANSAAAACRAARRTSLELCSDYEASSFSATAFEIYRNWKFLVQPTTLNNDASV